MFIKDLYSAVLPVFRGKLSDGRVDVGQIEGTCFSIGKNHMLTAGHVAKTDPGKGEKLFIGLSDPKAGGLEAAKVIETELLPGDCAILKVEFPSKESQKWVTELDWHPVPLAYFDHVESLGFPYGIHAVEERRYVISRTFRGHIVSILNEFTPIGSYEKSFPVYEVSFGAPRGLSGAPLLTGLDKSSGYEWSAVGLIIGNSKSGMKVIESEEYSKDSAGETKVSEVYEYLSLGIAVQANHIFEINSRILGSSIKNYLSANNLFAWPLLPE